MEDNGIQLIIGDDGGLREYVEPFTQIVIETEEDYNALNERLSMINTLERLIKEGHTFISVKDGRCIHSIQDLISLDK